MNTTRHRSGQMQLVSHPVDSTTVIEQSDMVYVSSSAGEILPASSHNFLSGLVAAQAAFADVFLGIAYEQSRSGDDDPVSVDISPDSVYEFDVVSATYTLGAALGPANVDSAILLDDQRLAAATGTSAVARSFTFEASAVTKLRVKFGTAYNVAANTPNSIVG